MVLRSRSDPLNKPSSGDLVLGPSNMNRMSYPGWVAKEVKFRDTQPPGFATVTVLGEWHRHKGEMNHDNIIVMKHTLARTPLQ